MHVVVRSSHTIPQVPAAMLSQQVIDDYEQGIEYAEALEILDMRQKGDSRRFLIRCVTTGASCTIVHTSPCRWADGTADSWEDEEFVSPSLVAQFLRVREEQQQVKGPMEASQKPRVVHDSQPVGAV